MSRNKPKRPRDLLDVLIGTPNTSGPSEDDDANVRPPPDGSWRARHDGPAAALAMLGVGFGFLLLIVPGILALRDRRSWQAGVRFRPRLAWALGGGALWVAVMVPLMLSAFRGIGFVIGVLVLPIVVRVAARE